MVLTYAVFDVLIRWMCKDEVFRHESDLWGGLKKERGCDLVMG